MRFLKKNRLLSKKDFSDAQEAAIKISQKQLLLLFKNNEQSFSRLGLVVGKRVAPLAVSRNRIKRTIRESFRLHQKKLIGLDIIVIARRECDTLSKLELREGMNKLWERLIKQYPNRLPN